MALLLCGLSLLQFTPSCAVWKLTQIFLITTATCRGPSSTVSLWVETQTPLLPWQAPLQGLIMGRNRYPQVGSRAVKLFKRHRSWQIACMNCTASGSELQGEPVFGRRSGWSPLLFWSEIWWWIHAICRCQWASTWERHLLLWVESWKHELVWKRGDIPFGCASAGKWLHVAPWTVGASPLKCTGASSFS